MSQKVAFVSNNAWSIYNFRLDILKMFIENGHEVIVIAPDDGYSAKLTEIGCRFYPVEFNNRSKNVFGDLKLYRNLRRLYRELRPDFIFHYVIKPNIYGSLAASAEGIPSVAVITGLGYSFAKNNWLTRVVEKLYQRALEGPREVWFLNNEDANIFLQKKLVDIKKVRVLPGEGVNTEFFSRSVPLLNPGRKQFNFLMATRLLKSKGVEVFANAARILKNKNYDVNFTLLGIFEEDHPDAISKATIEDWQKEGLIDFKGYASDVRPFLDHADCFVFPSFYKEGVPRCLMEAASMELPIITAYNRGCKEVVMNNSNGFICKQNDPFDLAEKMEKMVNLDDNERVRMGKYGRLHVHRKFGIDNIKEAYQQTISSVIPD